MISIFKFLKPFIVTCIVSVLSIVGIHSNLLADELYHIETKLGVVLPIPSEFQKVLLKEYLATQKSITKNQGGLEEKQALSFIETMYQTDDEWPTVITVISIPWGAEKGFRKRHVLVELPEKSGPISNLYVESFFKGYLLGANKAGLTGLRQDPTINPLLYDHERKMVGAEVKSAMLSPAALLLSMDDSSDMWQQIRDQGVDVPLYRCILKNVSNTMDGGKSITEVNGAAAQACEIDYATIASITNELTPAYFQNSQYIERVLQIVSNDGVTLVRVEGYENNGEILKKTWNTLWNNIELLPDAAIHEGLFSRVSLSNI